MRSFILAVLMGSVASQAGCVPYPLRYAEQDGGSIDAGNGPRDGGMDVDIDASDITDSGTGTVDTGTIDADIDVDAGGLMDAEIRDAGTETGTMDADVIIDAGDVMDSGIDSSIRDAGDVLDSDIRDSSSADAGTDSGPDTDAGTTFPPCITNMTVGPDIILPIRPGAGNPFSASLGNGSRIHISHLAGNRLYFTSLSRDGMTTHIATRIVNSDLATMETGIHIPLACSRMTDRCATTYMRSTGDLVLTRINSAVGTRIGTESTISPMPSIQATSIAYNQSADTYGVAFCQTTGSPLSSYMGIVRGDGSLVTTVNLVSPTTPTTMAVRPSIAALGTTFGFTFQDSGPTGNDDIYFQSFLATTGASTRTLHRLTSTPSPSRIPHVYTQTNSFRTIYQINWLEVGGNINMAKYDEDGTFRSSPSPITALPGSSTTTYIHAAEQFLAWYNESQFAVSLIATSAGVYTNQIIAMSAFSDWRPIVVTDNPSRGAVIYFESDGNLHMRQLSCR